VPLDPALPQPGLRVAHAHEDGVPVARLLGELDLSTVPVVAAELFRYRSGRLVLDLGELDFLDVSGLSALLDVEQRGVAVTLRRPSRMVLRILTLLDLTDLLDPSDRQP
jgi:anti-anti-sigma factor